jgi:hypothetical protein
MRGRLYDLPIYFGRDASELRTTFKSAMIHSEIDVRGGCCFRGQTTAGLEMKIEAGATVSCLMMM